MTVRDILHSFGFHKAENVRSLSHPCICFYFLIGNLQTKYWSSLSNIHLTLLCSCNVIKSTGFAKASEPLLNDLRVLERGGISIEIVSEKHHVLGIRLIGSFNCYFYWK
jgi:hypothetical protein